MKTCVCAIVKNEHLYIKEWADYHLKLGFDDIYIYEDYDSRPHNEIFKNYNNVHISTLKNFNITNTLNTLKQLNLYNKFLYEQKQKNVYNYIAFIDVDEFIVLSEQYNLQSFLQEYNNTSGVFLCWKNFNASGHIKRPDCGIMKAYTTISPVKIDGLNRWNIKSIVNVLKCPRLSNLHHGVGCVKTNGDPNINSSLCYKKAWINHYFCKSFEDYCDRMLNRGNFNNNYRTFDNFFILNPDMNGKKTELINSVRYRKSVYPQWLSRNLGIRSGGNTKIIEDIEKQFKNKIK